MGFILLGIVVILWVGSSTLIQTILEDSNFNKPFFLTYFSTSNFSWYFIDIYRRRLDIREGKLPRLRQTFKIAAQFCPLWFMANYFYNLSLTLTSIASSTILSSTSGVFTLFLSIFILKTKPDVLKFLAVLLSFGGISMIALADTESQEETVVGDFLALIGAVMYALYCIFISAKSKEVYLVHMFACVGVLNFTFLMPLFLVFNYTGLEKFEFPTGEILGFLFLNAIFGTVLSDVIWAFSIKYLNPALSTLGITLTIPLSMIVDSILHGYVYSALYICGAILVIFGFVIMAFFEHPVFGKLITNEGLKKRFCMKEGQKEEESKDENVPLANYGTLSDSK